MSEPVVETSTEPDDAAIEAEVAELTASPADQQADKVKNALIAAKRELRTAKRRNAELEPIAENEGRLRQHVASVQPYIDVLVNDPKLRADALRVVNGGGTRVSADTTEQPTDDQEAAAFAENVFGFYLPDQVTPDVARARRAMDLMDRRNGRQTDERLRPLAGVTLGQKADSNIRAAMAETDTDGVPMASEESIREVAAQLPPQLLADPKVVDLVLNNAIGIDRRKGRTPKAPAEPLYVATSGGGRRESTNSISSDERKILSRLGLNEKDYKESSARLEDNAARRRGTTLE